MLKVQIEFLDYEKYKPLFESWEGDYEKQEDGRNRRALSLQKIVQIVEPLTAIKLSDKIFKPKNEALLLRNHLRNRRLRKGKYSIYDLLKYDTNYFSQYRKLINQSSELLSLIEMNHRPQDSLLGIWKKVESLAEESPKKYKFEERLSSVLGQILRDEPEFGFALSFKETWEPGAINPILFNEHLYNESLNLYNEIKEEFIYEKLPIVKRSKGFIGGCLEGFDSHKKRKQEIKNSCISADEFQVAIREDLAEFFRI